MRLSRTCSTPAPATPHSHLSVEPTTKSAFAADTSNGTMPTPCVISTPTSEPRVRPCSTSARRSQRCEAVEVTHVSSATPTSGPHARHEVFVAHPGFAGPHRHGLQDESAPLRHARQQKMQARKAIRGDEQLAALQISIRQRADDGVQRGGDVLRRGHRAGGRADEIAPSREELVCGSRATAPTGRRPACPRALRSPPALARMRSAFPGKHADGVVQEIP